MPPLPGEARVLTIFADIHYYFTAPVPKPHLHRFDKASYLYLYHNATQQKTRIEIANNPGTADQDAFNGGLDKVFIQHSSSFPTRCTITVEGQQGQEALAFPPPPGSGNPYEWQLPTSDSQHPIQRLHTLDLYFWTQSDTDQFLDLVEHYLPRAQIDTDRHPFDPAESNATSTVVQQLENVAITDPAYQNGQTRNSHTETSVVSPAPIGLPPPPPMAAPTASYQQAASTSSISPISAEQKRDSAQFTPLPYNPAAPAAPEPIKHREKTPPPPDAADGNGLAAAVAADNGVPYPNSTQPQVPGAGYAAPPPPSGQAPTGPYSIPGGYASPPPSAGLPRPGSFPPQQAPIQSPPASVSSFSPQSQPSFQSPQTVPSYPPGYLQGGQQQHQLPTNIYGQPQSQPQPQQFTPQQQPQQPQQQLPPSFYGTQVPSIGGYSNYSYDTTSSQSHAHSQPQPSPSLYSHQTHPAQSSLSNPASTPGPGNEYSIHNAMYRPTEAEASSHLQDHAKLAMQTPGGNRPRKLEDSASRVESSVNRFLKKLEKKL
ncbi:uncharacterized protein BDV14DRAFT_183218 [Aspergillus stella-maris]|uniref:uncharacterized protein n=1 Tax=Aspergillus stella-maris TaxID=1810926 RepID=UPI003CCD9F5D